MSDCNETDAWQVQVGPQSRQNELREMYEKLLGDGQWLPLNVPGCNSNLSVRWCRERLGDVLRDGRPYPPIDGSNYLYHGTDQDSALSILRDGIQLEKGSSCQDFSDMDGFYVNHDYGQAKTWAHEFWGKDPGAKVPGMKVMMKRKHPAVIVFKMETNEVIKHLKFTDIDQKPDWQKLVQYNRSGRNNKYCLYEQLERDFYESDYVSGPVCEARGNPWGEAFHSWLPSGYESPNSQLCVLSKALAKQFTSEFVDSVILFGQMSDSVKTYLREVLPGHFEASNSLNGTNEAKT